MSGVPVDAGVRARRRRVPGRVAVHPRAVRVDVPVEALDDAHVRGLRHRARHQPALPRAARRRRRRAVDRVRPAHAHGPRLRRPARRWARSASAASRSTRSPTWRTSTAGIDLGTVTTSMTINSPAAILLAMYIAAAERGGASSARARRHAPERHPQGVPGAEGVHLPAPPVDAARRRHDALLHRRDAALAPDLDLRVPHPRGRARPPRRSSRSRWRTASRTSRRARRPASRSTSSRRACRFFFNAHIDFFEEIAKYRAARRIWARWMRDRYGAPSRALAAAPVPHPDRGRVAHRAAARGQHRAHRHRGARRRARRHAEPPHELDGRGARAPVRQGRPHRAADPAGDRQRDPRRRTWPTRSAARGSSRSSPTRWSARPRPCSTTSTGSATARSSRACSAASSRAGSRARSPSPPTSSSASSTTAAISLVGRERRHAGQRRATARDPAHRARGGGDPAEAPRPGEGRSRRRRGRRRARARSGPTPPSPTSTSCPRSSTRCRRTRRWARSSTRWPTCSAATAKTPSSEDGRPPPRGRARRQGVHARRRGARAPRRRARRRRASGPLLEIGTLLRQVGRLPRRGGARRRHACCSPSTTTAARRRTRPGGSTTTPSSSTPRTGRMDTLPFFRRTIERRRARGRRGRGRRRLADDRRALAHAARARVRRRRSRPRRRARRLRGLVAARRAPAGVLVFHDVFEDPARRRAGAVRGVEARPSPSGRSRPVVDDRQPPRAAARRRVVSPRLSAGASRLRSRRRPRGARRG